LVKPRKLVNVLTRSEHRYRWCWSNQCDPGFLQLTPWIFGYICLARFDSRQLFGTAEYFQLTTELKMAFSLQCVRRSQFVVRHR